MVAYVTKRRAVRTKAGLCLDEDEACYLFRCGLFQWLRAGSCQKHALPAWLRAWVALEAPWGLRRAAALGGAWPHHSPATYNRLPLPSDLMPFENV